MRVLLLAVLVLGAIWFVGRSGGGSDGERDPNISTPALDTFPITLTGTDGVAVTFTGPPKRIVSLSPSITETLCAIGAGDQIVAVDRNANCPLGSTNKPALNAATPNIESIVSYQPDLVYVVRDRSNVVSQLRGKGITVLFLEVPGSLPGVTEQIEMIGGFSGHRQASIDLATAIRTRMQAVQERIVRASEQPRVYHEIDQTYRTASPRSFVGEFYSILRARNIAPAGGLDQYPQLSSEAIVNADPEVIVLGDVTLGISVDDVRKRPGWDVISAVKNGRICAINPDIVSRPGPRVGEGLEALAKCLYPELF